MARKTRPCSEAKMGFRTLLKNWVPPALVSLVRQMRKPKGPADWEYCPRGWETANAEIKGWNHPSVATAQELTWAGFASLAGGTGPLGINHTDLVPSAEDVRAHNIILSFGYALALTARGRPAVSILDWGGGIGHYGVLAQALLPETKVDYFCKDVPVLCQAGRRVFPSGEFNETWEECETRTYDLVLASGSLHYSSDWAATLADLARVCNDYLLITRLPMIQTSPSFVMVQRPYGCGYQTEYLGWCLNKEEFLSAASNSGLALIRELLVDERPIIQGAPEQPEYRGFLFKPIRVS